jgi:mannose-6-phosphate isomerase-like protein (cupin superfamily)
MDADIKTTETVSHISDMATYEPGGHAGTVNVRLVDESFAGTYEMILGTVQPGGFAETHHHGVESQAMYIVAGRAKVALGGSDGAEYGPGTIVRMPAGLDHYVESLGPEPLQVVIVYSPAIKTKPVYRGEG